MVLLDTPTTIQAATYDWVIYIITTIIFVLGTIAWAVIWFMIKGWVKQMEVLNILIVQGLKNVDEKIERRKEKHEEDMKTVRHEREEGEKEVYARMNKIYETQSDGFKELSKTINDSHTSVMKELQRIELTVARI